MYMKFASRQEAGQWLGARLKEIGVVANLVVGLPRGGVLVGAEVATALGSPLEVLVVRKIGHPLHREFAVGALAEHGVVLLHEELAGAGSEGRKMLDEIIEEETRRLQQYESMFHISSPLQLANRNVVLVDDGLATGSTMEAAVLSARKRGALQITVAVPVSSKEAALRMSRLADRMVALCVDPDFRAVGCYYDDFPQVEDEEVIETLRQSAGQGDPGK